MNLGKCASNCWNLLLSDVSAWIGDGGAANLRTHVPRIIVDAFITIKLSGLMVWLFPIMSCFNLRLIWPNAFACVTACVRSLLFSNCMHFVWNNKQSKQRQQHHRGDIDIGRARFVHVRSSFYAVVRICVHAVAQTSAIILSEIAARHIHIIMFWMRWNGSHSRGMNIMTISIAHYSALTRRVDICVHITIFIIMVSVNAVFRYFILW